MKKIPLSGKVGAGMVVLVDDENYQWLSNYSFTLIDFRRRKKNPHNYHYVTTRHKTESGKWITISIHQLIVGKAPSGYKIDHIDRDTLNNQRSNLRIVSNSVSAHNKNTRGKSKYRGVHWDKQSERWKAEAHIGKKLT